MLKYKEIINKLTLEQKIRILTNVGNISGKDMKILGIPNINVGNMSKYGRDVFPHAASLARAWNPDLWGSVAMAKTCEMIQDKVTFVTAPGARVKFSPYRKEPSEDPYLASVISGTYMKAAAKMGVSVAASGYYLTESDVKWMDEHPDERIINEFLVQPYQRASEIASSDMIMTDVRFPSENYANVCHYIQSIMVGKSEFLICEKASAERTVDLISRGVICLKASANTLDLAIKKYRKIKNQSDFTVEQLEDAITERTAISDEMIDESLDTVLDFIFKCNEKYTATDITYKADHDLEIRAIVESTVLLKNRADLLPLAQEKSVVIIGESGAEEENSFVCLCKEKLVENGYKSIEVVKGYDLLNYYYHSQNLENAVRKADVAVLLLRVDRETEKNIPKTEKLTLPANQLYCTEKVRKLAKKVVVVILSDHTPDIEFTQLADSVLLTPLEVRQSASVIAGILSGEYTPLGKLAATLYAGTETSFAKNTIYMHKFGCRSGPFIGYRYYDTANMCVGYPFGHGLSYTQFRYSGLSISDGQVSFTVKNVGNRKGSEVAQVYIGADNSSVIRPMKELCGFAKVDLLPNEKRRITINFETPKVFYDGKFVTEGGSYSVYVGASVSDIRLKGKYRKDGIVLVKTDNSELSDYLQTYSNILKDKYTLEAESISMKRKLKNILIGVGALILAISLAIFNVTVQLESLFLGVVSGILAIVSILFLVLDAIERNKEYKAKKTELAELNTNAFADAEQLAVLSAERMFADEFDSVKEENLILSDTEETDYEVDYFDYINEDFRIKDAVSEFSKFAQERGFKLGSGVAENLFSSFTVSRAMLFTGLSSEEFNSFVSLISEYFDCFVSVDDASETNSEHKSVYYTYDVNGDCKKKNIILALQAASKSHKSVQISAVDNISPDNTNKWMDAFTKYVRSTRKRNEITIIDGYGKHSNFSIGRNFWIALRLANGFTTDMLSQDMLKSVSVVKVSFSTCEPAANVWSSYGFTSYQADYMLTKEAGKHTVQEQIWKKLDKLEAFAKEHSGFVIGNKLWLDLEKMMEMLMACDFDINDAIDAAMSIRILPPITAALRGKLDKEERTVLQTVEFVLGSENIHFTRVFLDGLKTAAKEKTIDTGMKTDKLNSTDADEDATQGNK